MNLNDPDTYKDISLCKFNDIVESVGEKLASKINSCSYKAASILTSGDLTLSRTAFEYEAKTVLKDAVMTYCAHKKWEKHVPIIPYVSASLDTFFKTKNSSDNSVFKGRHRSYCCPVCLEYGVKETLTKEDNALICDLCEKNIEDIPKEIEKCNNERLTKLLQSKLIFIKSLFKHSPNGKKCPHCEKFIPNSYVGTVCPYLSCNKQINLEELEQKVHPITYNYKMYKTVKPFYGADTSSKFSGLTIEASHSSKYRSFNSEDSLYFDSSNYNCKNSNIFEHNLLLEKEEKVNSLNSIREIILGQKKANSSSKKIPIKTCMYDAFIKILEEYPEEMTRYLINGGQIGDISIQATIFQKFIDSIEERLPIIVYTKGYQLKINNLLDENLKIFNGVRGFDGFIDHNLFIKKRNQFIIDKNGNRINNDETHHIGKIISIMHDDVEISDSIDSYSFSIIKMRSCDKVKPGSCVNVKYYSIYPSYTMGAMIHLQRIKKHISESLSKRGKNNE